MHNIEENIILKRGLHHPLFSYGFRPFFLLAALQAVVSISLWVYNFQLSTPIITWNNPALWHGHEMIFGFAIAVIAGFLLTAVPKWTGSQHLRGFPILGLSTLWLLGRISMYDILPPNISAIIDISFIPALICALALPIFRAKKIKNIAFLLLLFVLMTCNIFIHLQQLKMFTEGSNALLIAVFIIMQIIVIVGGRVMPMFTRNALLHIGVQIEFKPSKIINILAIISLPTLLITGLVLSFDDSITKFIAMLAALIHFKRLTTWQGIKAYKVPIVWILHLGYLWLIIGLIGLALFNLNMALHAFTAGMIGTMILAMMSRVTLGHTGRIIHANKLTVTAYILLQIAVIIRLLAPFFDDYTIFITLSGALWVATFILFLISYAPILMSRSS